MAAPAGTVTAENGGWLGRLELAFAPAAGRTVPVRRRHRGPLRLQRVFHPEDGPCHAYVLHPPGGVVGGDRLEIDLEVRGGGHALVTTPAANKLYRSAGRTARIDQRLRVAAGAGLEWLPLEQIVFDRARAEVRTRVDLEGDARFLGWEITCLGRPAAGEAFRGGRLRSRFGLWRDGCPLMLEHARFDGGGAVLAADWGLGGAAAVGTLTAVGADDAAVNAVREAVANDPGRCGVTRVDGDVLVLRWLGAGAEPALRTLERAWTVLRPRLTGRPACPPRIWRT